PESNGALQDRDAAVQAGRGGSLGCVSPERPRRRKAMTERELRGLIDLVKQGTLSRRRLIAMMARVGLAAPLADQRLARSGVAIARRVSTYKPRKRGGGGTLKLLGWQAPTLLNPHFAVGTKDQDGSRLFYEPLSGWDPDGNLVPILAAEVPSQENGGLARDGK